MPAWAPGITRKAPSRISWMMSLRSSSEVSDRLTSRRALSRSSCVPAVTIDVVDLDKNLSCVQNYTPPVSLYPFEAAVNDPVQLVIGHCVTVRGQLKVVTDSVPVQDGERARWPGKGASDGWLLCRWAAGATAGGTRGGSEEAAPSAVAAEYAIALT